jgi:hypothetical protein
MARQEEARRAVDVAEGSPKCVFAALAPETYHVDILGPPRPCGGQQWTVRRERKRLARRGNRRSDWVWDWKWDWDWVGRRRMRRFGPGIRFRNG